MKSENCGGDMKKDIYMEYIISVQSRILKTILIQFQIWESAK